MSINISSFPAHSSNPYLDLFYGALSSYGVQTIEGFRLSPKWLVSKRSDIDAVHFHWPEWLWNGRFDRSVRALLKLFVTIRLAKALGIKLIWTIHNLDTHEGGDWQDRWGQRLLAYHCDLLIVHSQGTAMRVRERLRPHGVVVVMPHGSYEGHYPEPRPRATVLEELGLKDDRPVLCCIGRLRDYKGLDLSCEACAELGDEVQLLIAGTPHSGFDIAPLEHYAEILPQLTLMARTLDDQEFADIISVSDAALLPYRQITGSGALLAAWTEGCGVIASDLDFFREMISETSAAGRLFSAGDAQALASAVRDYLAVPEQERRKGARAEAAKYAWDRCVRPVGEQLLAWQGCEAKPQQRADELHVENVDG